ncbi:MAG TPA: PQQ-binding-like beta-propeller repeat protein [Vicinamibacterales bacterium]
MTSPSGPGGALRLWPGLLIVALLLLTRFGLPLVAESPAAGYTAVFGGLLGGVAVFGWWLFFSRAAWADRVGAVALLIVALAATSSALLHPSIATGMMGMMFFIYAIPLVAVAFVLAVAAGCMLGPGARRVLMAAAILTACGSFALLRSDGIRGDGSAQFAWRWVPTAEEQLLAESGPAPAFAPALEEEAQRPAPERERRPAGDAMPDETGEPVLPASADVPPARDAAVTPAAPASPAIAAPVWAGFRGAARNSRVEGVRIGTNWIASPPSELWHRPVGPGWSSFAVRGDRLYTQEQRGEAEVVACYDAATGTPVWTHEDPVRFWEANGGAGPRATPTLAGNQVLTLGATGLLNALDAADGTVRWTRNTTADTGASVPYWGFSSSPLVLDDLVVVYAGALAAYDRASGDVRWVDRQRGDSYSSPQLVVLDGVAQVVQMTGQGAIGLAPDDGRVLWQHPWDGFSIVQPAALDDGVLISTSGAGGGGLGVRRLAIRRDDGGWSVSERWTSNGLKPYFNDFVVHEGYAYGFDGRILSCIDLETGTRAWKGGRYGNGQMVLLADQDLLLVTSEDGELALVRATPDRFEEIARMPILEGKTWNHPVLAGDLLLTRNGEEMAAYRLPPAR